MTSNNCVVLVIGHSFVQGFGKHIDIKRRDSHSIQSLESFAKNYLRVSGKVDLVKFIGDSGATVMDDFGLPGFILRNMKPKVVICECNDIRFQFF